jgi:hypothetical protein
VPGLVDRHAELQADAPEQQLAVVDREALERQAAQEQESPARLELAPELDEALAQARHFEVAAAHGLRREAFRLGARERAQQRVDLGGAPAVDPVLALLQALAVPDEGTGHGLHRHCHPQGATGSFADGQMRRYRRVRISPLVIGRSSSTVEWNCGASSDPAGALLQDRRDDGVEARVEEERDRVALLAVAIDHAMRRRQEQAVGPDLHRLAEVDDEAAFDRRHPDPLPGLAADLEAAHVVLGEQRERAVVGVRPRAEAAVLEARGALRRGSGAGAAAPSACRRSAGRCSREGRGRARRSRPGRAPAASPRRRRPAPPRACRASARATA